MSISDRDLTIYLYDYESGMTAPLVILPPGIIENSSASMPPRFVPDQFVLSPDGEFLAILQARSGSIQADYLHQLDLFGGELYSAKLHEGANWAVPIVPGRQPGIEAEEQGLRRSGDSVIGLVETIAWAPDGRGLLVTIGDDTAGIGAEGPYHHNGQLYFLERGAQELVPLAVRAPGNDVGFDAEWSPSGRYVTYRRDALFTTIWLIDTNDPATASQVAEAATILQQDWAFDESLLIYVDFGTVYAVDMAGKEVLRLWRPELALDEFALFDLVGDLKAGDGYVIVERRRVGTELDPDFQQVLYLDRSSLEVAPVQLEGHITDIAIAPIDRMVWTVFEEAEVGALIDLPDGTTVLGPDRALFPPSLANLPRVPSWWGTPTNAYVKKAEERAWSSDLHLIAGYRGDRIAIWDVLTGNFTSVGSEIEGDKLVLGWIRDP